MKLISMLPALAGLVILTGCETPTPSLLSLESVAADSELASVEGLAGAWENGDQTMVIHHDKDNTKEFQVLYLGGGSPVGFKARSFRAGDALFLEVTPDNDDSDFRIPGHAIARIWLEGGAFRWCFLDSDWFKQKVSGLLAAYQTDKKMLLLSPGPAVRAVLARFGADEQACGDIVTWQRFQ
jgi:hypothetical protein